MLNAFRRSDRPAITGFKALKRAFIEWHENPQIDFDSKEQAYDRWGDAIHGKFTYAVKSLEEACNISHLGSGCFADAYAINDKYVIKVIKNVDTGYARFVDLIKQHRDNPHFPKIYYSAVWAEKQIYIMERLESADTSFELDSISCDFRDAVHRYGRMDNNQFMTVSFTNHYVEECARLLNDYNMTGDLHGQNLMFRGDVPVVTDPTCD